MILWIYVVATFLGIWAGYLLKVRFTGPGLSVPAALFCIFFNCFLGFIHMGVALHEELLFFGDISSLTMKHPMIMFFALISTFVQSLFIPFKTESSSPAPKS
jgi:hypothetical protein